MQPQAPRVKLLSPQSAEPLEYAKHSVDSGWKKRLVANARDATLRIMNRALGVMARMATCI